MNRRSFLLSALAAPLLRPQNAPFLRNDVGPLGRVLVHTPGPETIKGLGLGGEHGFLRGENVGEEAIEQHRGMVQLLKNAGAQVLQLDQALDEAIDAARSRGVFRTWLRDQASALAPFEKEITGAALLGRVDKFTYFSDPDGDFQPLTEPRYAVFTRDPAFMTPKGLVICNFLNEGRRFESVWMRFLFEHAPSLRKHPIVFDAVEEQVALEGGDAMVIDERTLFLGVGNRSSEAAARRLARKLDMDVLAVQMPSGGSAKRWTDNRTPLHNKFLHLDTICTFVDHKKVVTLPWFLEAKFEGKDPLTRMLQGLRKSPRVAEADADKMIAALRDLGRVRLYKAGSGERDASVDGRKLVDHLRATGHSIVFVGGEPDERDVFRHATEAVLHELEGQGANVVATAPGKVVAYGHNAGTLRALREAGVEVATFRATELVRRNGGPHCLTMPLERQ